MPAEGYRAEAVNLLDFVGSSPHPRCRAPLSESQRGAVNDEPFEDCVGTGVSTSS
jgi:hypothetical protein